MSNTRGNAKQREGLEWDSRSGNDDLGVNELLVESRVLTLLVRGGNESVTLVLEPFPNAELVFGGSQKLRDLY